MSERKERTITIRLTESDCKTLMIKCGEHGITINELFENFAGDLAGGRYTNGSDERRAASEWFDCCWFGMFPEKTLLNHLLNWDYDPEEYFELISELDTFVKETDYLNAHPEEKEPGDTERFAEIIASLRKEIQSMADGWSSAQNLNLPDEIRRIADWIDEKNQFINGSESLVTCREKLEDIDLTEALREVNYKSKENDMVECYTLSAG